MHAKNDNISPALNWLARLGLFLALFSAIVFFVLGDSLLEPLAAIAFRKDGSHGVLVPLIFLYFIWDRKSTLLTLNPKASFLPGMALMSAGLLVYFVSKAANDTVTLPFIAALLFLQGSFLCVFGKQVFKSLWLPLCFLFLATPLPKQLYFQLSEVYRQVSMTSLWFLQHLGLSLYAEGIDVYMPNAHLRVIPSCSGVRYLFPYIVLGFTYAYLFKRRAASLLTTIGMAIPLSFIAGFLRLFTVFVSVYFIGPFMADEPHVWISWAVFFLVFTAFIALDMRLAKLTSRLHKQLVNY